MAQCEVCGEDGAWQERRGQTVCEDCLKTGRRFDPETGRIYARDGHGILVDVTRSFVAPRWRVAEDLNRKEQEG